MLVWYLIKPRKMRSRETMLQKYPARLQQKDDDCLGYLIWGKWDSLWNGLQPEMISLMCVMSKNNHSAELSSFSHASGKGKRWSHETVFPRETFDDWEKGSGTFGSGPQCQGIRAPSLSIFSSGRALSFLLLNLFLLLPIKLLRFCQGICAVVQRS